MSKVDLWPVDLNIKNLVGKNIFTLLKKYSSTPSCSKHGYH